MHDGMNRSGSERGVRVGAVNWDCSLPSSTYFGFYQTRTLSPEKYRTQTPYYSDILAQSRIDYHIRTQEEYDRELKYAIDAGIDYFAFVLYSERGESTSDSYSDWEDKVYELNYARKMYESSELKSRIGMAVIMGACEHRDEDYAEIARLTREPYYERVNGRPIIYLFSRKPEYVEGVCRAVEELGGEMPLFFAMISRTPREDDDFSYVDGLSAYACGKEDINGYAELIEAAITENDGRANAEGLTVPTFTTGWDPSPRIDIPSPWVDYKNTNYAPAASRDELVRGGERFADWYSEKERTTDGFIGHILVFAWNEFEEGGWICPTYNEDMTVNTDRVEAFREITEQWRLKL